MAFCIQCGSGISEADRFCHGCGTPVGGAAQPQSNALPASDEAASGPTPAGAPGSMRRNRLALIGGGGAFLLIATFGIGLFLVYATASAPTAAAQQHLLQLSRGESEAAWRAASSEFQKVTALEDYRTLVGQRSALLGAKPVGVPEHRTEGDLNTVYVELEGSNRERFTVPMPLRREGIFAWRVSAVDLTPVPASTLAGGSEDVSGPSPDAESGPVPPASPVPPSATSAGGKVTSSGGVEDASVEAAMASADAFYYWYLNKWEEPDLEPEWFEKSEDLSPGFRRAWKQLQDQSYRENEGVGPDYDPVVGSQNIPPGGFRAVHGEPAGQPGLVRVVMLGVGWDFFLDLLMRLDEASGNWQVDAIDNLNRGDVAFDPVEIPAERRAAVTLEVFLELMALGEPWQAYELTSTGFQRRADIDHFRAFPDSASFPPRRTPASRRLSGDGFRQVFAIEVGEGSEALLIDEAGESIWSVHHLRIGSHEIGVPPGPALEVKIGGAVMGTGRDPASGQITGQDYVFDAAGREPVSVDIPLSNGFPGLNLELSVLSYEFGQTLLETVVPVPVDAGAETVVRWEMPRTGRSWQGGNYQLVIRVPDGPVRKEVFGLR